MVTRAEESGEPWREIEKGVQYSPYLKMYRMKLNWVTVMRKAVHLIGQQTSQITEWYSLTEEEEEEIKEVHEKW